VRPVATVVVHRDRVVAEALAAALGREPGILAVGTTVPEPGDVVDAAVIDSRLAHADAVAARLRSRGVRTVGLGVALPAADVHVPADRSMRDLALAVAPNRGRLAGGRLSVREHEVLTLAGRGLAGKQVARLMGISPKTVEHHKTKAYAKLGVPNQAAAVAALLEES
jgi:DNA-binding CsgD family transcriptional regulator